jgi:micrococcal nuclease
VRLVVGAEARDRYGRLLAYVYRASDGLFVNAELLRGGYAHTLTIAPNDRLAPRFAQLQDQARAAGRGLWSACPVLAASYG